MIVPPEPELPDGVEKLSSSFASSASADMQPMHYSFLLRALKNGAYTIKPAEVKYWARGEEKESTAESGEITFKAVRFALVENNTTLLSLSAWCCWPVRLPAWSLSCSEKKRRGGKNRLQVARRRRTGRRRTCCRSAARASSGAIMQDSSQQLSTLRAWLLRRTAALTESLAAMLEKVQFGGVRPPAEEIERILRQLEKNVGGLIAGNKKNEPDYQKYCK